MPEANKGRTAPFLVPLILGLLPTAFLVGRAHGEDVKTLTYLERRIELAREIREMRATMAEIERRLKDR